MKDAVKNIDAYLALQPEKARGILEKLRQSIRSAAPGSEEVVSYGLPAFKHHGRMLMYFGGFKNHCSLFPGSKSVILKFKNKLKPFKISAGTISFTLEKVLPATLVVKIVKARVKENLDRITKKATNKQLKKK